MSMIAPARLVSYRILLQIATSDAHSDELLRSAEVDALSTQDRNLTTTLVLGTLRWQLALDARIRLLLARPGAKLSVEVATALRMGAYQLGYLERVPPHAVLHDSVELVKQGKERGAAGMVNAVLRKFAAQGQISNSSASIPAGAHPAWMVERWVRRYGQEAAEAICQWDQEPAANTIRLTEPEADLPEIDTQPGAFLREALRVIRGDVGRSSAFRDGRFRIQDEASQLVAEIAAAAAPHSERVLDTCAAPGGKTAILGERLPDAEITAVDVSRKRLDAMRKLMSQSVAKPVRFEVADAAKLKLEPQWNLILCDVPCSGTGTMARNPEIRLRVSEEDLGRQHARQVAILRAGLAGLAPGGRLVYSTCSLEPEENEQVVDEVLGKDSGVRVVPLEEFLDRLAERGVVTTEGRDRLRTAMEGGFLRTVPGVHPCDGFFAAVLERAPRTTIG
jgi:16S rRNA (cytosine967-C5)-methyltransferase